MRTASEGVVSRMASEDRTEVAERSRRGRARQGGSACRLVRPGRSPDTSGSEKKRPVSEEEGHGIKLYGKAGTHTQIPVMGYGF